MPPARFDFFFSSFLLGGKTPLGLTPLRPTDGGRDNNVVDGK